MAITSHSDSTVDTTADAVPGAVVCEVDRMRFARLLDDLVSGRRSAICVWAAAGSGKTVLVAAWARALIDAGQEVLWVSGRRLDREPDLVTRALARRADPSVPLFVLVDDAHAGNGEGSARLLETLDSQAPSDVRVVLSGRYQPFPTTTYLEATGLLTELRTADLAFTIEETAALATCHDASLPEPALTGLFSRTAGWATALALAMTLLRDGENPFAVVERFTGDHRAMADYLVGEVLASLSEDERDLLLSVAVADRVPLDLAVALSGRADAGAVIQRLARHNSLITEGTDGIQYHPVLSGYLRAEARRRDAVGVRRRHALASRWYAERGAGAAALEHATASEDRAVIAETVDRFGLDLVLSGTSSILMNALARVHQEPEPISAVAIRLLIEAPHYVDASRARHLFAVAERAERSEGEENGRWSAVLAALRCFRVESDGVARDRLARLRADDIAAARATTLGVDLLAVIAEASVVSRFGRLDDAVDALREAAHSALHAGYDLLYWMAAELASTVSASAGRWEESAGFEDQMAARAQMRTGTLRDRAGATAVFALAGQALQRCTPMPLERLDRLIALDSSGNDLGLVVPARTLRLLPSVDADPNPRPALDELERLMRETGARFPRLLAASAIRMVALRLTLDGRERAAEVTEFVQRGLGADSLESITARFLLDPPTRAAGVLETALEREIKRPGHSWHAAATVDAWLVLARAAQSTGRLVEADERMARALELARRLGTIRPFVARGGDGAALAAERLGRLGHLEGFAQEVIDRVAEILPPVASRGTPTSLTPRERAILRELPAHQSVAEIARKQTLSVNTIKTHLRNIYQKLDASDRSEAVQIAQERGLL